MRWVCSLAASVAVIATSNVSSASPSARLVYLRNAGAEACPDESAVRAAVSSRLGYDPFFPSAAETMFIEISRDKTQYRARVKLVDANNDVRGTREIAEPGSSCSAMIDTLALSISIAIDPDSLTRGPVAPPAPEGRAESPEPAGPTEPAFVAPPPRPDRDRARDRDQGRDGARAKSPRTYHFELWAAPAVWFGSAPSVAFGGELGARVRWPHVSLGLSGRGDVPSSRTIEGINVSVGFVAAVAAVCGHLDVFSACALGTVGRLTASSDAAVARDDRTVRFLVGASIGAELPATDSLRLFARVIGNEAIGAQTVVLSGVDVYDLPHLSVGLEIGAGVRF